MGTLMMLLFGWGWAKPVPVNPAYFKNRKLGMALTAFAGPVSNLLMSFFGLFIFRLIATFLAGSLNFAMSFVISEFFSYLCLLNVMLAIFNLLPVPPLDGSRIMNIILPERYYFKVMQYERYIYLVVILALVTDVLDAPLGFACSAVLDLFNNVLSLLPFLS